MKLDEYRVRGRRERLGLTLAMLARKAGTSKNTILSAEHGADIRPTTARKIAEALDVEIADLLGEAESPLGEAPPSQEKLFNNGVLEEEERREDEGLAVALITAVAEDGERLEEDLKEAVGEIPLGALYQFNITHSLARLLYEECSRNRQVSAEFRNAKERLDAVGKQMEPLIRQLIEPGATVAGSRERFASVRAGWKRQEAERQDRDRIRNNETA